MYFMRTINAQTARVDIAMDKKKPRIVNIDLNPNLIKPSEVTGINLPKEVVKSLQNYHADIQ